MIMINWHKNRYIITNNVSSIGKVFVNLEIFGYIKDINSNKISLPKSKIYLDSAF